MAAIHTEAELPMQVLKKFRMIFGAVREHFHAIERQTKLSGSQLWMLNEIVETPGIGVSELAQRLSIHQSTCSQLTEKLVHLGMVAKVRSQHDQRRVGLTASPAAARLVAKAPGPVEGVLPKALSALSATELRQLNATLSAVIAELDVNADAYADKPLADIK